MRTLRCWAAALLLGLGGCGSASLEQLTLPAPSSEPPPAPPDACGLRAGESFAGSVVGVGEGGRRVAYLTIGDIGWALHLRDRCAGTETMLDPRALFEPSVAIGAERIGFVAIREDGPHAVLADADGRIQFEAPAGISASLAMSAAEGELAFVHPCGTSLCARIDGPLKTPIDILPEPQATGLLDSFSASADLSRLLLLQAGTLYRWDAPDRILKLEDHVFEAHLSADGKDALFSMFVGGQAELSLVSLDLESGARGTLGQASAPTRGPSLGADAALRWLSFPPAEDRAVDGAQARRLIDRQTGASLALDSLLPSGAQGVIDPVIISKDGGWLALQIGPRFVMVKNPLAP